jgi:clan AA aspartic protease
MKVGTVNDRNEAVVRVRLSGPSGAQLEVDAIIDTGFTDSLSIPNLIVAQLGLVQSAESIVYLADGSKHAIEVVAVEAEWMGFPRQIFAYAMGREVLVGMRLLAGYELRIEMKPGGVVEITKL